MARESPDTAFIAATASVAGTPGEPIPKQTRDLRVNLPNEAPGAIAARVLQGGGPNHKCRPDILSNLFCQQDLTPVGGIIGTPPFSGLTR